MANDDVLTAKLNEVTEILSALASGRLREIINPSNQFSQVAGCSTNCDCKNGYCGCNASVTMSERFGYLSYPEFLQLRETRIRELQRELALLEPPKQSE